MKIFNKISSFIFIFYTWMFILSGLLSLLFAHIEIKPFLNLDLSVIDEVSVNNFFNQYRFLRAVELGFGLFCFYLKDDIFKNKKHNKSFYSIIVGIILAIMFILEYFLVPMQNTIFYALLLIMSIGTFLGFHFAFVPKDHPTQMEKILSWTGMGLFGISLLGLLGFISNDYTLALIMGVIVLIIVGIGFLARRKGLGEMT